MNLQVVRVYLSIVEAGSFAAAARQQHISQPAVSMIVSSLEEQLGQKLFQRTQGQHSRIQLTRAGEIFREYAYKYIDDYSCMRMALVRDEAFMPVAVATSPTPGSTLLPLLIQAFKEDYPQISCMVQAYSGHELLNRLLQRQCELFVTGIPLHGPDVVTEKFFYDPMELICPLSMRVDDTITLKQLKKLPLITRNLRCNTTQLLIAALEGVGLTLSDMNVTMQVYGNSDVLQAVAFGSGVGFITRSLLATSPEFRQKVKIVSVKRLKIERHLHLAKLRKENLSPGAQIFWDYALETRWRQNKFAYDTTPH